MFVRSNLEEFILLCATVWPVLLGIMATLRVLTGVTKHSALDASEGDEEASGALGAVAASVHTDVEKSTDAMRSTVHKVENQIVDGTDRLDHRLRRSQGGIGGA